MTFTNEGVTYLLKRNDTGATDPALQNFAFSILPTIIFFAAFSSLLFYLGVIQIFVKGFGYVLIQGPGTIRDLKVFQWQEIFFWDKPNRPC